MTRLIPIAFVVAGLVGLLVYSQRRQGPLLVSGFVEADEIRVGSRVGGRVLKVRVEEGQEVSSGQTLIELEPFDLNARLAEATHTLERADAVHQKLSSGFRSEEIAQGEARLRQAEAELELLMNGPDLRRSRPRKRNCSSPRRKWIRKVCIRTGGNPVRQDGGRSE